MVDFLRCFTTAEDVIWTEKSVHGQWLAGLTAGGCGNDGITSFLTNPQYLLSIRKEEERVEVSMALMQMGRRQLRDEMGNNTFLAIGITVFPLRYRRTSKVSRKDLRGVAPIGNRYGL